jgi:thiol:disulfide interchange protein DsbC
MQITLLKVTPYMLKSSHSRLVAAAIVAAMLSAQVARAAPDIEVVKKSVKAVTNLDVVKVQPSKIAGLYEVQTPGPLFYTDAKGEYILLGAHAFSTKDNADYSQKRMNELAGYKFADLPLKDAIKVVRGDGKRVIVTLEDPNCGYCKQLSKTLDEMGNTTHYVFMVGMLGPESVAKANAIWCSPNPAKSWMDWMSGGKAVPAAAPDCETPVERNGKLGQKYRVQGTPAIFFPNGDREQGAAPAAALERRFANQAK